MRALSQYVNELCGGPPPTITNNHRQQTLRPIRKLSFALFPSGLVHRSELRRAQVENIGVEPMTSCVQGRRSSQLS